MVKRKSAISKKQFAKRSRHPLPRRIKWWLRTKWQWFKRLKWWQKALLIGMPIIIFVLVIPLIMYAYFATTMGDMETLMNRKNTGVVLRDIHGETFYSTGTAEHRDIVPLDNISKYMQQAVVASEDRNFYEHGGFSILSTFRAFYGYVFSGSGEFGGSTLTQQLAKMTVLSSERGFLRQYQAFSVAAAIEQRYSKDEILAMYLNSVYFGENSFGVDRAAKVYFNKKPADLSLAESAMLVGLLPAPSVYSPISGDADKAVKRQTEVLSRMVRDKMISEDDKQAALAEQLALQGPTVIVNDAPHFTEMVLVELYDKYGEERVARSGFQVTTTLDLTLQRAALASIASQKTYIERMGGSNTGVIAVDPKTGEIRALVGSVDYSNEEWGKVNMVTTKRQPGSTFKPIYYAAALADGVITPATIIRDEPINIDGWQPQNATRRYYGNVTVRQALARSLNIPSIKIMQDYGLEKSIEAAKSLGITSLDKDPSEYGLSIAIGSAEVPLQQMTNAYAAFADGGNVRKNTSIQEIKDKLNSSIYKHASTAKRGISEQGAYLVSNILADQSARSFMFGSSLNISGKTVAVKTGTTDDNRDAWAIGYTPDIAIGVWVGNNDNSTMVSGGADMAGPIWRATMTVAIGGATPSFSRPLNIVERYVCYGGGLANTWGSNTYTELFLSTALPTESCSAEVPRPEPEPEPEPVTPPTEDEEELDSDDDTDDPSEPSSPPSTTPTSPTSPTNPSASTSRSLR